MNLNTGEIRNFDDEEIKSLSDEWMELSEEDMTAKQKETMQVSKHDNKSKLGKMFTGNRAERRRQIKEARRILKKGKK